MSEYVFRTEKPIEYCYECPLNNSENGRCRLGVETSGCEIPKKCSLVELPEPHGDLKDTDAIVTTIKETYCKGCNNYGGVKCRACLMDDCLTCIEDAPTILEARK